MGPVRHPALSLHHKAFLPRPPLFDGLLKLTRLGREARDLGKLPVRIGGSHVLEGDATADLDLRCVIHPREASIYKCSFELGPTSFDTAQQGATSCAFSGVRRTDMTLQDASQCIGQEETFAAFDFLVAVKAPF